MASVPCASLSATQHARPLAGSLGGGCESLNASHSPAEGKVHLPPATRRDSGCLFGAPSACQENKSSRGAPRLVPIAALLSEFASCGAPQSARALWPLWPDIRGVRAVLTATARGPYR